MTKDKLPAAAVSQPPCTVQKYHPMDVMITKGYINLWGMEDVMRLIKFLLAQGDSVTIRWDIS